MTNKKFKRLFNGAAAAFLAAFSASSILAADFSFDRAGGGASILEAVQSLENRGPALAAPSPAAAQVQPGARTYDFKTLYGSLGYPSPTFFGSSETEVQDLDSYTSKYDTFYEEINGYLRFYPAPYDWSGTGPEDAKLMVANIDRVFDRVPALPADMMLFRGLDLKFRASKPYAVGEEFIDKGYVSTSASYKVARYFAVEMNDNATTPSRKAVFVLYLTRPGEKGILIDQNEDEVILKHGRKFRVMAKKEGVKKYDLYLVQACSGACAAAVPAPVSGFWNKLDVRD